MASSKVVSTNPDLPRDSSITNSSSLSSLLSDLHHHSMDDLLKSIIYTPNPNPKHSPSSPSATASASAAGKSVDDVWTDIVGADHSLSHRNPDDPDSDHHPLDEMTLEAFLTKAGAVNEDDVRGVLPNSAVTVTVTPPPFSIPLPDGSSSVVEPFAPNNNNNGIAAPSSSASPSVSKGKRRAVEEPVDKATLQKQRRMIKNRESAARSRERKQAYTSELESLVLQLEQENAKLLSEEAEKNRRRYKELMEFLIPITEQPRPKGRHRRTNSY